MLHKDKKKYLNIEKAFDYFMGQLMADQKMDLNDPFDKEILVGVVNLRSKITEQVQIIEKLIETK